LVLVNLLFFLINPWFCFIAFQGFFVEQNGPSASITGMKKIICDFSREKNGNSKLTQELADEIKALHKKNNLTQRALALEFNISKTQVHRILKGISWG